jgi:hypothetical protein
VKDLFDLLIKYPVNVPSFEDGILEVCRRSDYDRAQQLWEKFGMAQFEGFYERNNDVFNDILGISKEDFPTFIQSEIERTVIQRNGYPFDNRFVGYFSGPFSKLWKSAMTSEGKVDEAALNQALEHFPYKDSKLNFIPEQLELYHQMQRMEKTKGFPSTEYWRYAIDARAQDRGCCAFEDEPGYLKGFFKGMIFALETRNEPKTAEWYEKLQGKIVEGALKSDASSTSFGDSTHYVLIGAKFRKFEVSFGVSTLDQDGYGRADVSGRNGSPSYKFDAESESVTYKTRDPNETRMRAELKLGLINEMLPRADIPAKRLFLYMYTARELEIEHVFTDANGRASHLAFLSMVAGDKELPMFLFPDPNVFDVNGPESLGYRYIEACVKFSKGGVGHTFERVKQVKKLETLELHDPDLVALREELIPLVKGKGWTDAFWATFPKPSSSRGRITPT